MSRPFNFSLSDAGWEQVHTIRRQVPGATKTDVLKAALTLASANTKAWVAEVTKRRDQR